MSRMVTSRRNFLTTAGSAALAAAALPSIGACAGDGSRSPSASAVRLGIQLYTLRNEMQRDVSATLARVAEIGYREVEFAGYFDHTPARIAALVAEHGLSAPSSHIDFSAVREAWSRTLDSAARAGHAWVTLPWIDEAARRTADDWRRVADLFNERGAEATAAGLRFAYHNQGYDFVPVGDITPIRLLLERTQPGVVDFQLDVYWATSAGADPSDLLTGHPDRFVMTHLKDSAGPPDHRMVDVGSGRIDFARVLAAADSAGVQHHFIEHDEPTDAFESATTGFVHIAGLRNR